MDTWDAGELYEIYMGRWSRRIAEQFLDWLALPAAVPRLDVGCGTGALASRLAERAGAGLVTGIDLSPAFIDTARRDVAGATFDIGDASDLPYEDGRFGATVSGLALNFVPEPAAAVREMTRVTAPGGVVAAYVWDYGAGMEMLRRFWDAAIALDPAAAPLDEARRFPLCAEGALAAELGASGLADVEEVALTTATRFRDFEELWAPFLGGQGPAPSYVAGLAPEHREALESALRARVEDEADGTIALSATAWAVRGCVAA